jgi:hypothetical protein
MMVDPDGELAYLVIAANSSLIVALGRINPYGLIFHDFVNKPMLLVDPS